MNSKFLLLPTALMVAGHSAAEAKGKKSCQQGSTRRTTPAGVIEMIETYSLFCQVEQESM